MRGGTYQDGIGVVSLETMSEATQDMVGTHCFGQCPDCARLEQAGVARFLVDEEPYWISVETLPPQAGSGSF